MGLTVLYSQQRFMRKGRLHSYVVKEEDTEESGGVHVHTSLCFSLPREITQNVLFPLEWKCRNMCAIFMPREIHWTLSTQGFTGNWSHGYPLSSIHLDPRLPEGKQEFGISLIVCTNSSYNELLLLVNWCLGPLCQMPSLTKSDKSDLANRPF